MVQYVFCAGLASNPIRRLRPMGERGKPAPALHRVMRAREYFTLAFGSIVGVGWMLLMGDWLKRGGPIGAMLGFLLVGVALIPVVCIYGRLSASLPEAGTEIAYTAAVFPRWVSFATGWAMTLATAIVCPFEAVSLGQVAAYAIPQLKKFELYQVAGSPVYLPQLLLGLGATVAITWINFRGIRFSALLQNLTTFGLLAIFALFTVLGLSRGRPENLEPYFAGSGGIEGNLLAVLAMLQITPYFMMGFETIPKCSEEADPSFAPTRFGGVMLLSVAVAAFFYVTVIGVVAMLQPWQQLLEVDFPTAVAFQEAFGWPWLVQLIMVGVLLSLVKVFNGNFLAATRLLYAMGRRDLAGGKLGDVHQRYQTPFVAIALVGGLTFACTFLGKAVLVPIADVGSLCGAAVWMATALAFFCGAASLGRKPGELTWRTRALGAAGTVVAGLLLLIVALGFTRYHWIALAAWVALGFGVWFTRRGGDPFQGKGGLPLSPDAEREARTRFIPHRPEQDVDAIRKAQQETTE